MNDVDELLEFIVVLRLTDKAFGQLPHGELFAKMGGQEQHQTQSTVDLAAGLECRTVFLVLGLDGFGVTRFADVTADCGRDHRSADRACGLVGKRELTGCMQTTMIGIHGFLRADDGGTWVFEYEHGQIIGIGVCHVQVFAVHIDGRSESTRIDDLDQGVRNMLGAEAWGDGIETKTRNRGLRHARCGA